MMTDTELTDARLLARIRAFVSSPNWQASDEFRDLVAEAKRRGLETQLHEIMGELR